MWENLAEEMIIETKRIKLSPSPWMESWVKPCRDLFTSCTAHLFRHFSQGQENFFCNEPDSKYFLLYTSHCFCCSYSVLPLCWESSHRKYIKECMCLCCNKILFMNIEIWISNNFNESWNFVLLLIFQPFKNVKITLSSWASQKQAMGQIFFYAL